MRSFFLRKTAVMSMNPDDVLIVLGFQARTDLFRRSYYPRDPERCVFQKSLYGPVYGVRFCFNDSRRTFADYSGGAELSELRERFQKCNDIPAGTCSRRKSCLFQPFVATKQAGSFTELLIERQKRRYDKIRSDSNDVSLV